ncbi:MAG TPA: PASTA domain-containing protein [bacterium]|nr:PASTA domain-containing protein [bacterium]HOL47429.1 PASTA domain-containing protein [bacterium]HPQ19521.1 PASTA domain-containing protein [bacterium]
MIKKEQGEIGIFYIIFGVVKKLFLFYFIIFFILVGIWTLLGILYKTVKIPDVQNLQVKQAQQILEKKNLKYIIEYKPSTKIKKDFVIYQYPEPEFKVKEGREIVLVVSSGQIIIEIPDFKNLPLVEALRIIGKLKEKYENVNFRVVNNSYIYSNIVPADYIIAQTPLPNTKLSDDVKISFLISKGEKNNIYIMPDLIGKNIDKIKRIFSKIGLNYNVYEKVSTDYEENAIISQSPEPLSFIDKYSNIVFYINKKKKEEISTATNEKFVFFEYIVPSRFSSMNIKIILVDEKGKKEIYNKNTAPGVRLEFREIIFGTAFIEVYIDGVYYEKKNIN